MSKIRLGETHTGTSFFIDTKKLERFRSVRLSSPLAHSCFTFSRQVAQATTTDSIGPFRPTHHQHEQELIFIVAELKEAETNN